MAILKPTEIWGEVTWLGTTADSETDIASVGASEVAVGWEGFDGDCHSGLTRPSCVRVKQQYARDTEIRNTRQISVLSEEELAEVADRLSVPAIRPEWVGANMIVRGIPDFTLVPPNARLIFENNTALTVDMENAPCRYPADKIEEAHPGHGRAFPQKAVNKRGVTVWVERTGSIKVGDRCRLHVPPQRLYPHVS
ncbi:MAG: MOSC domain-containing protein [Pseudomonadota bacterium]